MMITKLCKHCGAVKSVTEFYRERKHADGLRTRCKACESARLRAYNVRNAEKHKVYNKEHYPDYYSKNCERIKETVRRYRANNKEKTKAADKAYHSVHPRPYAMRIKDNAASVRESSRRSYLRRKATVNGQLSIKLSTGIRKSLKRGKQGYHWEKLVGYSVEDLKKHIESLFTDTMTWDKVANGEIHIDHKIPLSFFKYMTYLDTEFQYAWSLDNLQPMWACDNLRKSDKLLKDPTDPNSEELALFRYQLDTNFCNSEAA